MHEHNEPQKGQAYRFYTKSPTVQNVFQAGNRPASSVAITKLCELKYKPWTLAFCSDLSESFQAILRLYHYYQKMLWQLTPIKVVCVSSFRILSDELYVHGCRSPVRMQTPVLSAINIAISGQMHSFASTYGNCQPTYTKYQHPYSWDWLLWVLDILNF